MVEFDPILTEWDKIKNPERAQGYFRLRMVAIQLLIVYVTVNIYKS